MKPAKSQVKWYGLHPSQDKPAGSVTFWHCDVTKLNSSYSRIARSSALTSPAPPSRTISQDTLRRWEKSAREATYVCNQSAGLSRCINKVQQGMADQLKIVNSGAVDHVLSVKGQPQKKGVSRVFVAQKQPLKYVNNVFCVDHLCSVRPVPNVAQNLPVGARLSFFGETWDALGASQKAVQMLREGYTLPFQTRPNLTRSPRVVSCYVHSRPGGGIASADKNAVELVQNQKSLGFYNQLFLVPKPNNKWRPILDLSNLNKFLKVEKFKMETPETIRTSLQTGEWVTFIDFKDAYFHIPIQTLSRKYLRFHVQGKTYQFKALPFGLFDSSSGVHCCDQRGQNHGLTERYKDPPVPR